MLDVLGMPNVLSITEKKRREKKRKEKVKIEKCHTCIAFHAGIVTFRLTFKPSDMGLKETIKNLNRSIFINKASWFKLCY